MILKRMELKTVIPYKYDWVGRITGLRKRDIEEET